MSQDQRNKVDSAQVGFSMIFACARPTSFVVASHSKDLKHFESEIDNAG